MPASLTRVCPSCATEKVTQDFRDTFDWRGRPPVICASCRSQSRTLQARQAANVAKRPANRDGHREYAARTWSHAHAVQGYLRPEGLKTCPEGSGCGNTLPLSAFQGNRYQPDMLASICGSCTEETNRLHA